MEKILHITDNYLPDKGGGPTHISNIINNTKLEHKVITKLKKGFKSTDYFDPNHEVFRVPSKTILDNAQLNEISIISYPFRLYNSIRYYNSIFRFIKKNPSHILHLHGVNIDSNLSLLNKYINKQIHEKIINFCSFPNNKILTLHNCQPLFTNDKVTLNIYNNFIYQFNDIICVDKSIFNYCQNLVAKKGLQKNLHFLPNSVDLETFKKKASSNSSKKLVIGFAGRITDSTNFGIFIELVKYFKDKIRFKFAISSLDYDISIIKKELNLANEEDLLIDLSKNQMPQFYNECDIILNPIKHSATSLVTIEAMSCAKPVIMLHDKERIFIKDYNIGFLISENIRGIINLLNRLDLDRSILLNYGNNARKYAEKNYSNEILMKKLESIYKAVSNSGYSN